MTIRENTEETAGRGPARARRLLLVDDHAVVRRGMAQILNMERDLRVCAEAATASEALQVLEHPGGIDAAVIDITLQDSDGIDLVKSLRARGCRVPILVMSMHDESLYAERALRAGAQGYVMKHETPEVIVKAVRKVLAGGIHVSEDLSSRLLGRMVSRPAAKTRHLGYSSLSDRELEVFHAIGRGRSTSRIARSLNLSVKTIESYREHIKRKLGLRSGLELVRQAMRWAEHGDGSPPAEKEPRRQ